MSRLPDTTTRKPARRIFGPETMVPLVALLVAAIAATLSFGEDRFVPGEEIHAAGIRDIAAGTGAAPFAGRDASRFETGTRVVRVYLRVEDLPADRRMTATVERSARSSLISRFFGEKVRVDGSGEERLSASGNGVSGVMTFAVRADGALPGGEYTVEVRSAGDEGGGAETLLARKYFVVGDRQA